MEALALVMDVLGLVMDVLALKPISDPPPIVMLRTWTREYGAASDVIPASTSSVKELAVTFGAPGPVVTVAPEQLSALRLARTQLVNDSRLFELPTGIEPAM